MPGDNPENAAPENAAPEHAMCHDGGCRGHDFGWLKKRNQFLNVAKGSRAHSAAFVLQGAAAPAGSCVRFGLTVSKKNGNAVKRNRIKRRLRQALTEVCGSRPQEAGARDGFDYVVVARPAALDCPFGKLVGDLRKSLAKRHAGSAARRGRKDEKVPALSKAASPG